MVGTPFPPESSQQQQQQQQQQLSEDMIEPVLVADPLEFGGGTINDAQPPAMQLRIHPPSEAVSIVSPSTIDLV